MNTVWVTRTGADARSHPVPADRTIYTHLLSVGLPEIAPNPPPQNAKLIFTSSNGVNAFCRLTDLRHWPVYTVGQATGAFAHEAGFKNVNAAGGNVAALVNLIVKTDHAFSAPLYFATAKHISGDLVARLSRHGFHIQKEVLYKTQPVSIVPDTVKRVLETECPLTVFLYSSRGAKAFASLGLPFSALSTVSLSPQIDAILAGTPLSQRLVAREATHAAMCETLGLHP